MPITVQLPNGKTAQFPDGMAAPDIQKAIESDPNSGAFSAPGGDLSNVPGALPGMQSPQQAAGIKPARSMSAVEQPKVGGFGATVSNVGSHLKNMVAGPYHAFTDAPQNGVEQGVQNSQLGRAGLGLYRMFAEPTVNAIGTAREQYNKGNLYSNDEYDAQGNYTPSMTSAIADAIPVAGPWARNIETEAHQKGMAPALAGLGTDISPAALPHVLPPVGQAMQSAGEGVINKTVGSLASDFKRGANPGEGYFQAGFGPSSSMDSIAAKARSAKVSTGKQLKNLYNDATNQGVTIPQPTVSAAIRPPIDAARSVVMGPGGTMDTGPLDTFESSFNQTLHPSVTAGPAADLTPNDVFGMKRNVADNTNWSDPTQIGLKSVRQQTVGALGGVLKDAVPGAEDLASQYQNLSALSKRAGQRALTGSSPLTGIMRKTALGGMGALAGAAHSPLTAAGAALTGMAFDSIPARTSLASALYYGGKGAVAVGDGIKGLYATPVLTAPRKSF